MVCTGVVGQVFVLVLLVGVILSDLTISRPRLLYVCRRFCVCVCVSTVLKKLE